MKFRELPIGIIEKDPINRVFYGAKCAIEDFNPPLTREQHDYAIQVIAMTLSEYHKLCQQPL